MALDNPILLTEMTVAGANHFLMATIQLTAGSVALLSLLEAHPVLHLSLILGQQCSVLLLDHTDLDTELYAMKTIW